MATLHTVRHTQASSDRSYQVVVDADEGAEARMCQALAGALPQLREGVRLFVISDENVSRLHLPRYMQALSASSLQPLAVVVPNGEGSKSLAMVEQIARKLVAAGVDRDAVILALGGGVVSDLSGFVAATLLRGLPWAACPTTLLSQADAAIGGKTAVNLAEGKNLLGAFHSPHLVYADLLTLGTLPQRELSSGLGEVLKHALLIGADLWQLLLDRAEEVRRGEQKLLEVLVSRSCSYKAEVVEKDPFERDPQLGRAALNLGHTLGHALETASHKTGAPLLHGEAVALGLLAIARIGAALGITASGLEAQLAALLVRLGLPTDLDERLWEDPGRPERGLRGDVEHALLSDKKRERKRLRLVVLSQPGHAQMVSISLEELLRHLLPRGGSALAIGGFKS